jgi:hypothetical protein
MTNCIINYSYNKYVYDPNTNYNTPVLVVKYENKDFRNKNITEIDFHKRGINANRLNDIIDQLKDCEFTNGEFDLVDFSMNEIDDNAAEILKKFFDKYLSNPKSIDLSDNKLGSAVAKVLEEVLPRYKWLTKLFLINTNFTIEEQESIKKAANQYTDIVFK